MHTEHRVHTLKMENSAVVASFTSKAKIIVVFIHETSNFKETEANLFVKYFDLVMLAALAHCVLQGETRFSKSRFLNHNHGKKSRHFCQ